MSKAFLPTILEQKEKEVAQLVMEDLQPLRQTYRLYDFLQVKSFIHRFSTIH